MAKGIAKPREVELSYEGMGACVEAGIRLGGKLVCVIVAPNTQGNRIADEIAIVAKNYLIKKERERCQQKVK